MPWCAAPAASWMTLVCPIRLTLPFVRSPHAHARVVSVKTEEARKAKKVLAVLTAEDVKAAEYRQRLAPSAGAGRGGAKMVMPFRPSLAGRR